MRPLLRVIMNGMLMKTCTAKYVDKGVADDVKDITDIEGECLQCWVIWNITTIKNQTPNFMKE